MTSLQSHYAGTEEPPENLRIDQDALAGFLSRELPELGPLQSLAKFKGGQSNPTYLLTTGSPSDGQRRYVLRRKPPGALVQGAHAIDREFAVTSVLARQGFPVAHPWLYCEDEGVIGSAFYIADFVAGRVFWDPAMPGETPATRSAVYADAVDWLARLHRMDPAAIGLGGFGPPAGYARRNLALWSGQYRASELVPVADMRWLMDALAERAPDDAPTRLIHGDYGLYNVIFAPDAPGAAAVLDWEMATLGDPFVDIAHHLRAWWLPPAPGAPTLAGHDLAGLGIPSMEQQLDRYLDRMGLHVMPDRAWYLAYAQFRVAAMVQGVLARHAQGNAANRRSTHTAETVRHTAAAARRTLAG